MDSEKGFPPIPPSELPGPEWFDGAEPRRADALTADRASAMPSMSTGKTDSAAMPTAPTNFRSMVESAGAQWLGIQQSLLGKPELVMFRDPVTGSTCAVEKEQCSVDTVKAALERKRQQFKTEEEH